MGRFLPPIIQLPYFRTHVTLIMARFAPEDRAEHEEPDRVASRGHRGMAPLTTARAVGQPWPRKVCREKTPEARRLRRV